MFTVLYQNRFRADSCLNDLFPTKPMMHVSSLVTLCLLWTLLLFVYNRYLTDFSSSLRPIPCRPIPALVHKSSISETGRLEGGMTKDFLENRESLSLTPFTGSKSLSVGYLSHGMSRRDVGTPLYRENHETRGIDREVDCTRSGPPMRELSCHREGIEFFSCPGPCNFCIWLCPANVT